jgi:hypothetical protein
MEDSCFLLDCMAFFFFFMAVDGTSIHMCQGSIRFWDINDSPGLRYSRR